MEEELDPTSTVRRVVVVVVSSTTTLPLMHEGSAVVVLLLADVMTTGIGTGAAHTDAAQGAFDGRGGGARHA